MEPQMQNFVEALEKELIPEDIDTHIEGCIGCGNYGNACAQYLATNDPKYHPKTKSNIDCLFLDYIKKGRLPLEKLDMKVTLHYPCWSVRLTRYMDEQRELLKKCVTDFVEMTPNRKEPNLRRQVSKIKLKQIEAPSMNWVIAPYVARFLSIRDTLNHYEPKVRIEMLAEILSWSMEMALKKMSKSEMDKMKFAMEYEKERKLIKIRS